MTLESDFFSDPRSSLIWTYDAVHGPIDIRDTTSNYSGMILKILNMPVKM